VEEYFVGLSSLQQIVLIAGGSSFLTAWACGTIFTSAMYRLSWRWKAMDKPDGFLKCHSRPTATLGGIPLACAIITAGLVVFLMVGWDNLVNNSLKGHLSYGALLVAVLIVLSLGISDDLRHVMPRTKLLFQMLAGTVLISSGLVINRCDFFGVFEISCGLLAVPFTLFWLIGSCNAFNFIDGMDGLASGIGVVISLVLAIVSYIVGVYDCAIIALALAGGLLGLLMFNVRPAFIFLGDSGSQMLGLILGAISIKISTVEGVFALPSAGLILSVPIIDALLSILRRYSLSKSLACGDHKHIHHRLRHFGFSVNQATITLWTAVLLTSFMGIICRFAQGAATGIGALLFVMVELYLGIRLGCLDLSRLWTRISGGYRWARAEYTSSSAGGMAQLEILWERMKPLFEQMQLDRVILTLEGVSPNGQSSYQTYQWVRSEKLMTDLLASRWTKRFALDGEQPRVATLRLESAEQMLHDERSIEWLLKQIRENMRHVSSSRKEEYAQELLKA